MSLIHDFFCGKPGDTIDKILSLGHFMAWHEPIMNELQGYNNRRFDGDYASCVVEKDRLLAFGINARIEGNPISGYWVVTQE